MTQNCKVKPNLDRNTTKMLNLTVLRRIDRFVDEILFTSGHVTFYVLNLEHNQWSYKNVEGVFFVVKRNDQPRFQFIVMNRRNTDNLVENILGDFVYEVQDPFLFYYSTPNEINGIWFYKEGECKAVANIFERIHNAYSMVSSNLKAPTDREFEELKAVPKSAVIEEPLLPFSISPSNLTNIPDGTSNNFFSSAMNTESNSAGIPLRSNDSTLPLPLPLPSFNSSASTPALPVASSPLPFVSTMMSIFQNAESGRFNHASNLLSPSVFAPSPFIIPRPPCTSSTTQAIPPLDLSATLQRHGAPLLQPFPPPSPSPSLTPTFLYEPRITKDKVRGVIMRLAENDQFIDAVYREIMKLHSLR